MCVCVCSCGDSRLAEMCPLEMPLWDRLAVGLAFGYLVQYEPPNSSARQAVRRNTQYSITMIECVLGRKLHMPKPCISLRWLGIAISAE